ncbi:MAG: 30S ribosomal protein S6 [Bdellovibrionaceae bacterium]|nr:30S ribosomal protein S6 [Pseudobdellovibrionaceae bacterium]
MDQMSFYEQILVLRPETSESDHKETCQLVAGIIEKAKGEVFRVDTWGSRPISNPKAKKVTRGWYFHLLFSAPHQVIGEIRRQLSINRKVLYFHEEKLPKKETPASHIKKFLEGLEQTAQREKERLAKHQKKQAWFNKN